MNVVFDGLLSLEMETDDDDTLRPVDLPLSQDARTEFIEFCNENAEEQMELPGELSAAWSKLEGYAARLALLIHLVRKAAGDVTLKDSDCVDLKSMRIGIDLVRWFGDEAGRVYRELGVDGDSEKSREQREEDRARREQMRRIDVVRRRGGRVTVRDFMRSMRQLETADDAEMSLQTLVQEGHGHWEHDDHQGRPGRPTRRFVLNESVTVDTNSSNTGDSADTNSSNTGDSADTNSSNTGDSADTIVPNTEESGNSVNVNGDAEPLDDDWGEV
jgi:hypothetical protein